MDRVSEFLRSCMVVDVEATGSDYKKAEIIEMAFCMMNADGQWEAFDELYKPSIPITPEISAITNISNRMVVECKPFADSVGDFNAIVSMLPAQSYCVAHNASYDSGILFANGMIAKDWLCTLKMVRKLYKDDQTVTMYSLPYLRYRFDLDANEDLKAHRADADALVAASLLEHIVTTMISNGILTLDAPIGQQISEWLAKPTIYEKMPFGKHKGKRMVDVPHSYWTWAIENFDSLDESSDSFDKDLFASVAKAIGL